MNRRTMVTALAGGAVVAGYAGRAKAAPAADSKLPVASAEALSHAGISFDALCAVTGDGARAQAYLFADAGDGTLVSRFFFIKSASVLEDPATGSATANLGGWFLTQGAALPLTRWIAQGSQVGRPSRLRLRIDETGQVFVAGSVVELGSGTIRL